MIKRYNQFVKENKTNEEFEMDEPVAMPRTAPSRPEVKPDVTEKPGTAPSKPSPFRKNRPSVEPDPKAEIEMEDEEIGVDKYTSALQSLADAAGVEYNIEDKSVVINGKKVIFPTETEKYHVQGVKKPFATLEEVLSYFESGVDNTPQRQEVKDEMTSLKDEEVLDTQEQFESKSYKSKRFKK
jgi:hypothetical protein